MRHFASPAFWQAYAKFPETVRALADKTPRITLVCFCALMAMALVQSVLTDINGLVAALFYIVAGLGWVLPAISRMGRPDRAKTRSSKSAVHTFIYRSP
jgi:hypothetical protein